MGTSSGHWFYAPRTDWTEQEIVLPPDESHHAAAVLRVAPPDVITVTDGKGSVARCSVTDADPGRVVAEILESDHRRALTPRIVIYQGAGKGNKVDGIVDRLAELGVAELWVYESSRTVVKWDAEKVERLGDRWRGIARAAAKQSRNPYFLETGGGLSFTELTRRVSKEPAPVVLWEGASLPLRTALIEGCDRVALVIGPEGGLARDEAEALADAGAQLASLGPHVLRTELAPVVAASALMYHYGLIG